MTVLDPTDVVLGHAVRRFIGDSLFPQWPGGDTSGGSIRSRPRSIRDSPAIDGPCVNAGTRVSPRSSGETLGDRRRFDPRPDPKRLDPCDRRESGTSARRSLAAQHQPRVATSAPRAITTVDGPFERQPSSGIRNSPTRPDRFLVSGYNDVRRESARGPVDGCEKTDRRWVNGGHEPLVPAVETLLHTRGRIQARSVRDSGGPDRTGFVGSEESAIESAPPSAIVPLTVVAVRQPTGPATRKRGKASRDEH